MLDGWEVCSYKIIPSLQHWFIRKNLRTDTKTMVVYKRAINAQNWYWRQENFTNRFAITWVRYCFRNLTAVFIQLCTFIFISKSLNIWSHSSSKGFQHEIVVKKNSWYTMGEEQEQDLQDQILADSTRLFFGNWCSIHFFCKRSHQIA